MLVKPRRLDLSKVTEKKEKPMVKQTPKIEPIKTETVKKAPRKLIEEEEEKFNFSLEDEEK